MPQSELSELDRWRTGFPLETAWSGLAELGARQRYHRVASDEQQRRSQYLQMLASLWQRLSAGELIAYGWRVTPSESDSPVRIHPAMFDSPPDKADLDIGRFRFQSWTFDRVMIAVPEHCSFSRDDGVPSAGAVAPKASPGKRGRPRHDHFLRDAACVVAASDRTFLERSAEKQNGMIKEAAGRLFPGKFAKPEGPGHSTVARFVQSQRADGWPALAHPENPEIPK